MIRHCLLLIFVALFTSCLTHHTGGNRFGYHCGRAAIPPKHAKQAEAMVKHKNTLRLKLWLYGQSHIKQAFAIAGFWTLKNNGTVISAKTLQRINKIKQDTVSIPVCAGCTVHDTIPLKEALEQYTFE